MADYKVKIKVVLDLEADFFGDGDDVRTPKAMLACLRNDLQDYGWKINAAKLTSIESAKIDD